jgi:ABC-2 type transport system permease protein
VTALARPYLAALSVRFQLTLQYRAAALAGFATQLWWGGIKVMVYAAFYGSAGAAAAAAPISLSQTITYTWIAQAFLVLQPWTADPEVSQAVRTGGVGYDRLRPVDAYAYWYARSVGWMLARVAPRAALMMLTAALVIPLLGLTDWSWRLPAGPLAATAFLVSLLLAALLSGAFVMLLNVLVAATLNERGVNTIAMPLVILLTGNLVPLALWPEPLQPFLIAQPLAGVLDIPCRIYFGALTGPEILFGLALQLFWTAALVLIGRAALAAVMRRLQVQGG